MPTQDGSLDPLVVYPGATKNVISLQTKRDEMSTEDNKAIVLRLYDAFNRRDIDMLDGLLAPDFIDNTADPKQAPGRAGMKDVWLYLYSVHPAIRLLVQDAVAEDDKVATRVMFEGLSTPSGRGMMLEIVRITDDHIVELWNSIKLS